MNTHTFSFYFPFLHQKEPEKSRMGEKNKKNSGEKKQGAENKNSVTVVLKGDLHCEGCVSKVLKCIRSVDGVDSADIGDEQKITVVGKVDPAKLREKVEQKTHKKLQLISPQPKKDDNKNGENKEKAKGKENSGNENAKQEKKNETKDKNSKNKSDEKKSKEPAVTTTLLKLHLHCEGCIQKIRKIVTKTKGYKDMKIDRQKELVTVIGTVDVKALVEVLKKHLKKDVQIVPPKKDVEKKEKENAAGAKGKSGGEKGKSGGGGGGGGGGEMVAGGEKMDGNKLQFQVVYPHPYPYPFVYESGVAMDQFHYNPYAFGGYHAHAHAPQLFSDENPNACSVM